MVGWHHQLSAHEFQQTPGDSEEQETWCAQSMGSQRVGHYLVTKQQQCVYMIISFQVLHII